MILTTHMKYVRIGMNSSDTNNTHEVCEDSMHSSDIKTGINSSDTNNTHEVCRLS